MSGRRLVHIVLLKDRNGVYQYDSQYQTKAQAAKMAKKLRKAGKDAQLRTVDLTDI
jgi:hypothetical protein